MFALDITDPKPGTTVEVYDLVGNLVCTTQLTVPQQQVDLTGKPAGIYFWKIICEGELLGTGKTVIE